MTQPPADFSEILKALDVQPSDLMVHCSFGALARSGHETKAVIGSLLKATTGHALLMPAMSWRSVTPAAPIFDERSTPGITGHLSEVFRRNYATTRSLHPTHSVCGIGETAKEFLHDHHRDRTPCGPASPFRRLIEADGWCLLVNVGLERCTIFHCAEEAFWPDIYLEPHEESYVCVDKSGGSHAVVTRRHVRRVRDFEKFRKELTTSGHLRAYRWGEVSATAVNAAGLYAVAMTALGENRYATFANE